MRLHRTIVAIFFVSAAIGNAQTLKPIFNARQSLQGVPDTDAVSGNPAPVSIELDGPAPAGGATITLRYSGGTVRTDVVGPDPDAPTTRVTTFSPTIVTIAQGQSSKPLWLLMPTVAQATMHTVSASYNGVTQSIQYAVAPAELQDVKFRAASNDAGSPTVADITLTGTAPGGAAVTLTHVGGSGPASALIGEQKTVSVTTKSGVTATPGSQTLSATYRNSTKSASISIVPTVSIDALIASLTLQPGGSCVHYRRIATVTLTDGAATNLAVPLTSLSPLARVPEFVVVPLGARTATFDILGSQPQSAPGTVTIRAGGSGGKTLTYSVTAPNLIVRDVTPKNLPSGSTQTVTVLTNLPAATCWEGAGIQPAPPTYARLTANDASVVIKPVGSGSGWATINSLGEASFEVTTPAVATPTPVVFTGEVALNTLSSTITLDRAAQMQSLSIQPEQLYDGGSATGTVTLDAAAAAGGARIALTSSHAAVSVPPEVVVPQGQTSATFNVSAVGGAVSVVTIRARRGTGIEKSDGIALSLNEVKTVVLSPTSSNEGTAVSGTVTLLAPAVSGGVKASLSAEGPIAVPAEVIVPGGASSATFAATATGTGVAIVKVMRAGGSLERTASVTITPTQVASVSFSPSSVVEGGTSTATVMLNAPAVNAVDLTLSALGLTVPSQIAVQPGAQSASVNVTAPHGATSPTILARRAGSDMSNSKSATLTVTRNEVKSVTLNAASIVEGSSATMTVTLEGAAPAEGLAIALSSSNGAAVTVPGQLTIVGGANSGTFTASANAPGNATITARREAGPEKQAALIVSALQLRSLTFPAGGVPLGGSTTGTLTLSGRAPAGGVTVTVRPVITGLTMPAEVTIPAGAFLATFTVSAPPNTLPGNVTIEAWRGSGPLSMGTTGKVSATLTVTQ